MRCEQYRKFVIEAVLGELDRDVLAQFETHRASCEACQTDYCRVRELLDSIDRGVTDMLDVQPSAKFGAQVRQRLSESSAEQRLIPLSWVPAAAGGLTVIAVLTLLFSFKSSLLHEPNTGRVPAQVAEKQVASSPTTAAIDSEPRASAYKIPVPRVRPLKSKSEQSESKQSNARAIPEVIVPPGQWAAISRLAAAVSSGRVSMAPINATVVESIEPTEMASSELPVLEPVSLDEQGPSGDSEDR